MRQDPYIFRIVLRSLAFIIRGKLGVLSIKYLIPFYITEPNYIESLLKANKSRFKCGSKSNKRHKFWTLVKVGPPLAPHNKIYQKDSSVIDVNFKSKISNNSTTNNNFNLQQRRPALKTAENGKGSVTLKITKKSFKPKAFKDSIDSMGDSSDASSTRSFGSLDSFIPRPKDFHGQNNPFRYV